MSGILSALKLFWNLWQVLSGVFKQIDKNKREYFAQEARNIVKDMRKSHGTDKAKEEASKSLKRLSKLISNS